MDKGELIYKEKRGIPLLRLFSFFFLLIALFPYLLMIESGWEPFKDGVGLLLGHTIVFFSFFLWLFINGLPSKKHYQFYEHGIACYEKGVLTSFVAYRLFKKVECSRVGGSRRRSHEDYLFFWREDGSCITLKLLNSSKKFERIWGSLIMANPFLKEKLTCSVTGDYSQELYEELCTIAL